MEYACIKSGRVENTIVADADFVLSVAPQWDAIVLLTGGAGIGWSWNGASFVAPPPPQPVPILVPTEVTMRQAQIALHRAGLLAQVDAAIAGMPGPAGVEARITWAKSQAVQRHQPLVLALAPALGLSDAQLDALFITADSIP